MASAAEHRCGPTAEQIMDAAIRGDVIGTYPMCDACTARQEEFLSRITGLVPRPRGEIRFYNPLPEDLHGNAR